MSDDSKPTPGPWRTDGVEVWPTHIRHGYIGRFVNPANARLIAAAPEMLEALTAVRQDCLKQRSPTDETLRLVRAAIDKAKGRE